MRLNVEQIEQKLLPMIAEIKRFSSADIELTPEEDFITKYGLTSMDAVSLSIKISQAFGFGFGEEAEDIDGLASFGALAHLIQRRVA